MLSEMGGRKERFEKHGWSRMELILAKKLILCSSPLCVRLDKAGVRLAMRRSKFTNAELPHIFSQLFRAWITCGFLIIKAIMFGLIISFHLSFFVSPPFFTIITKPEGDDDAYEVFRLLALHYLMCFRCYESDPLPVGLMVLRKCIRIGLEIEVNPFGIVSPSPPTGTLLSVCFVVAMKMLLCKRNARRD